VESAEPLPYSLGGIFLILKTDAIVFSNPSSRQCEKQFIRIAPLQLRHSEAAQPKRMIDANRRQPADDEAGRVNSSALDVRDDALSISRTDDE
jgi:hypothetical protein